MLRPALFALLAAICLGLSSAQALDAPQDTPLLTVSGAIDVVNVNDQAVFDRSMLHALDWREIDTYTDFTEGLQRFAGPSLASLLDVLGVESGVLRARALDDYMIEIPVTDAVEHGVILALEHEGRPMRVRNRGPIWVIYPAATLDEINELHSSRMIWQLVHIAVEP